MLPVFVIITPSRHNIVDVHLDVQREINKVKQRKTQRCSWTLWEGWEQLESDHSQATCSAEEKKKLNKLDHNKLFSFNGASDKAGGVRKQNQSDSLAASAGDGKQKTPLNKHTGRYLASTEGRLESNRQGMVPELLEDSYISWIVVLVRRAHQLKWSNSTQKSLKLQMRANLFCT